MVDNDWMDRAACRKVPELNWDGPAAWPEEIATCGGCPVRVDCLVAALRRPREMDYGILAGLTASERESVRRRRVDPRRIWAEQGFPLEPRGATHGL